MIVSLAGVGIAGNVSPLRLEACCRVANAPPTPTTATITTTATSNQRGAPQYVRPSPVLGDLIRDMRRNLSEARAGGAGDRDGLWPGQPQVTVAGTVPRVKYASTRVLMHGTWLR